MKNIFTISLFLTAFAFAEIEAEPEVDVAAEVEPGENLLDSIKEDIGTLVQETEGAIDAVANSIIENENIVDEANLTDEITEGITEEPVLLVIPKFTKTADEGIQIQVERKGMSGESEGDVNSVDNGEVIITSPWPAKPQPAPAGWIYTPAPETLSAYQTSVQLGSGANGGIDKSVDLSITPFVLTPDTDGSDFIRISEPGFIPANGVNQITSIGTLLLTTTRDLAAKEQQAAQAIDQLQQLLTSLPK